MKKPNTMRISVLIALLLCSHLLISQNITKPNIQGPMPGIQVNAYNGNLLCQRSDLSLPAQGPDIDITFSYNSSKTLIDYGFGFGWTFTCNISYELAGQDVIIRREDGRKDIFSFDGTDYKVPIGFFDTLTQYLPNQYRLRAKNGLVCFFDDSLSQRVTKMVDRYGNTLTMTYNGQEINTLTDASGRAIHFTWANGRMTKITDPNFNPPREILYQYDGNGMPVQVTDAIGNTTQYTFDNERKITQVIDKRGTPCNLTYNTKKAVSGITSPITNQTITYDAQNLEVKLTEQVGSGTRVTTYSYDNEGNVINTQNPCCSSGLNLEYEYDPDRNMTKFTDGNGNVYTYAYDNNGNRLNETDPLGETRSWTYEPVFNRVTSTTDKNGNTTNYTYDAKGNLIESNRPESITEFYTYDNFGNRINYMDGNGNSSNYTYDSNGYLLTRNYPIGTESYTYDGVGNQVTYVDANGNTTTYNYDKRDRRTKTVDALGFETTYTYDPNDNQITMTDANGNTTNYTYDVLNRETSVARPIGTTTYTYDELDNRTSTTDPNGNLTQYEYNVQNLPTKTTNAVGDDMSYTYDANGNQVTMTDYRGNTTDYTYDELDRPVQEDGPIGQTFQYNYDPNSNRTSYTDANGNVTTYTYDGINRQVDITDPVGTTTNTYDKNSNRTVMTDANNNITTYVYDGNDRLVSVTDALGFVTTFTYDDYGNQLTTTDPNNNTTTFTYDARHLPSTNTNAENETGSFTYDGVRNTATEIWPNGNTLHYTYDANYRIIGISDLVGTMQNYTYDDNANLLSETDGNGNTVTYTYDALDRRSSSTDALGESMTYTYDPNSNLEQSTDRNGNPMQYEYDAINRQTRSIDALGNEIISTYDPQSNLTDLTDDNGNTTTYTYDAVNRPVVETFADNTTKEYTYDPVNNLLARKDNNGDITNYTYDNRYLLINRDYPDSNDDHFSYDPGRRMLTAQNNNADILYTYDQADRILSETLNGESTGYAYDIPNRMRTLIYPGGREIVEQRDLRERFSTVKEGSTTIASFTYDLGNRMVSKTQNNGVASNYTYNDNNWITTLNHTKAASLIAGFTYDFDKEGNKLFEEKVHHPTNSEQYNYDDIYRITGFKEGTLMFGDIPGPIQNDQFNYDGVGNRTATTEKAINKTYTTNNMNEYSAIMNGGTVNPMHDDNGNQLFDGTHDYTYDTENRLLDVDGGSTGEYQYDPFSRRIKKITVAETTHYFYDGWRVIEEQDTSNNTTANYLYGDWIDEVLTMDRAGETFFYQQNSLGSVIAMTDENGNVVERYEYEAYGKVSIFDNTYTFVGSSGIDNPYLFTGRRLDEETGLYYYRHRYYDSDNGRFFHHDPLDYVDGMNLYEYVKSNPLEYTDPSGLWFQIYKGTMIRPVSKERHDKYGETDKKMEYEVEIEYKCSGPLKGRAEIGTPKVIVSNLKNKLDQRGMSVIVAGVTYSDWIKATKTDIADTCPEGSVGTKIDVFVKIEWMHRMSIGINPGLGYFSADLGWSWGEESALMTLTPSFTVDCCRQCKLPATTGPKSTDSR